jgi:transposase
VRPFLDPGCLIFFDAGAYGDENAKTVTKAGFDLLSRVPFSSTDDAVIAVPEGRWLRIDDDVRAYAYKGYSKRVKVVVFSQKRHDDLIRGYREKAGRDFDEAVELKAMVEKKKRRKKYVNSNSFLKTDVGYVFPLDMSDRESCIEWAVRQRITGREGCFILTCTKLILPGEMLRIYRSRNDIEAAFRGLKHGIDWRPARCTSEDAIRGRIPISFLALFCMSMVRFLYPEFRHMTAESISEETSSFSLTVMMQNDTEKRRVFSNFGHIIRRLRYGNGSVPVPKTPGQTAIDGFGT